MIKILAAISLFFQILTARTIDVSILYEQNVTIEQTEKKLDEILDFIRENPQMINEELDGFSRAVYLFIFNQKLANTNKFDFDRIDEILKFKPDLNYDIFKMDSFKMTLLDTVMAINLGGDIIHEDEILKLARRLVLNGYDIKTPQLLNPAYQIKSFKIFSYLLENGAENIDGVMLTAAFEFLRFLGDNGYKVYIKEPVSEDLRKFIRSEKFANFNDETLKYLNEMLKFKSLSDIKDKDMEIFIKVNSYIDNAFIIKFLLEKGLNERSQAYEFLKKYTTEFHSEEILKLLKQNKI